MSDPYPASGGVATASPAAPAAVSDSHYLPSGLPQPAPADDGLGKEFWEATRRHELVVQFCDKCSTYQWGPDYLCNNCHNWDIVYRQVGTRGRIFSWERPWYPVHPVLQAKLPYIVVLVELPEAGNVRMVGNLLGDAQQQIVIGAEVEAVFEDHTDVPEPYTLVQWRVVE